MSAIPGEPSGMWQVRRLFFFVVALGVVVVMAREIVVTSMTTSLIATQPEAALTWRPSDSRALIEVAERRFIAAETPDVLPDVRRLALAALQANPLEGRAMRLLGLLAEEEGDEERSIALMQRAGKRSLRDPLVHGWLFQQRVRDGDFQPALMHLDVLLRTQPQLYGDILPAMITLATHEKSAGAVVDLLNADPPWRGAFLHEFSRSAADPSAPTRVYSALQLGPHPPRDAELRPHLDRLIAAGRFGDAFLVWQGSLTEARRDDHAYVHNGDFRQPITNLPFDWIVSNIAGATTTVTRAPMGEGQALQIEFGSGRIAFRHVSKLMLLPPGRFRLSGRVMMRALANPRGLQWRIFCASAPNSVLAETDRVTGTTEGWIEFAQEFTVPMTACGAQLLRLELASRIAVEEQVERGTAYYQDLRIERIGSVAEGTAAP